MLKLSATGLGPCRQQWYTTCDYGIRLQGVDGYDHRGDFAWDEGPRKGMEHGTAGPVASTGVIGDIPATLPAGTWTLSFRLYYGSDAISFNPVPGGTPRYAWEDPFKAACSTDVTVVPFDTADVKVAFTGAKCKVSVTYSSMPMPSLPATSEARLALDATGLGPCPVTFPLHCVYVIRLEGPDGDDHVGWFVWDDLRTTASASTGLQGDLPTTLPRGAWTFSFGRILASDVSSFVPVPGGTPRTTDLDVRLVACRFAVTVGDELSVAVHVAFKGEQCTATGEAAIP